MIGMLFEEGLFIIERPTVVGRDPLGKPKTEYRPTTDEPIRGRLEQSTTHEEADDVLLVNTYRSFFPLGTDLRPGDRVLARGQRYEVKGSPSVERIHGFPALDNLTAKLSWVGPVT